MTVFHIDEVQGTRFPAGRHTRVIVGPGGPVEAQGFVMGHVTIFPGGSVPVHSHAQEEVYFIARGEGVIQIDGEQEPVRSGSYVYIRPGCVHLLRNTAREDLVMIFCYAPKGIVDHWQKELEQKSH